MHSNFVQLAVDTGVLGLSAWLAIWVCFFRLLYQKFSKQKDDPSRQWILWGSMAPAIAFLAGGCFESNYYDSEVAMVLFFMMALPFSGSKEPG
jgi:O-antigen ligase